MRCSRTTARGCNAGPVADHPARHRPSPASRPRIQPRRLRLHRQHLRRHLLHGDRLPRLPRHHRHDLPDRLPVARLSRAISRRTIISASKPPPGTGTSSTWSGCSCSPRSMSGEWAAAPPCMAGRSTLPESVTGEREPRAGLAPEPGSGKPQSLFVPAFFTFLGVALLCGLGVWQLERKACRKASSQRSTRASARRLPLFRRKRPGAGFRLKPMNIAMCRLTGHFLNDKEAHLQANLVSPARLPALGYDILRRSRRCTAPASSSIEASFPSTKRTRRQGETARCKARRASRA